MNDVKKCSWASAMLNQDFMLVQTRSGYRSVLFDPEGKFYYFPTIVSPQELGAAVVDALKASRFINPQEYPDFFNFRERVVPQYEEWVALTMKQYSYKNRRAMFKKMKLCNIELCDGVIKISPNHHDKLEGWGRENDDGIEDVIILDNSTYEEVGSALRLAFTRCTG